ncbi:unannotated protein [freshwater metagenome]|uniref:Unannotated protein n=1 Tax=freshwater metagenome TaxID=449393 RepID=A0A6J7DNX3_9ZZZZ|nr:bifunctional oligoribonuclease/PAP phosphatase NrnA [Actinomycetota bacterium]
MTALEQVVEQLRTGERFLLVTHEHPDGDAVGSLLAMHGVLRALDKDAVMFIGAQEFPLPKEYAWLDHHEVVSELPADLSERVLVFLDCGSIERNPAEGLKGAGGTILNIDHHHDNTRFGTIDLVDDGASCTAEIVWQIAHALGAPLSLAVAEALYVGLITDTGRFMYENTGSSSHAMAAELIDAGVDVPIVYRRVYEGWPEPKLHLVARALSRVQRHSGGRLTFTHLFAQDFSETGALDSHTEGIVDVLRAIDGTKVAAVARQRSDADAGQWKVSLRSSDGEVDVSAIARAGGGGGHRAAAGFNAALDPADLVAFIDAQIATQR